MDDIQIFICRGDLESQWGQAISDAYVYEDELAEDLAIEQELGVHPAMDGNFEEVDIELVPIDWAEHG